MDVRRLAECWSNHRQAHLRDLQRAPHVALAKPVAAYSRAVQCAMRQPHLDIVCAADAAIRPHTPDSH